MYPWPGCIALEIVERIRNLDPLGVVRAMGLADPNPQLRPDAEIMALVREAASLGDSPFAQGQIRALGWTLGRADRSPASLLAWYSGRPTAAQVDAEHQMATGAVYRQGADREAFSGVDTALWQALGRR
jgi:hypothetical protein